jgi:hypothetical protein
MQIDFDDEIPDLTGKGQPVARKPFVPRPPLVQSAVPPNYIPMEKRFEEPCPRCHGRGRFISFRGRDVGVCFNCKGAGKKVFKTSPESRAKARAAKALKTSGF